MSRHLKGDIIRGAKLRRASRFRSARKRQVMEYSLS